MTENEKYLFDLQGYIAVKNALDRSQITELNRILDEHIAAESEDNMSTQRFGGLLDWGQPFLDLIDNGPVVPYLELMLGGKFRLDHVYLDVIRAGTSPIGANLHGGAAPFNPSMYYRCENGRFYNVGTGRRTSLKDLAECLCQLTGCDRSIQYAPRSDATLVRNRIGSPKRATEELGFSSEISLEGGLESLIEWRREHRSGHTVG